MINDINKYGEEGNRHGYWEVYYSKGNLCFKGNYYNGNRHGYWEVYWASGNLWFKGNFDDGKRHGYWEYYDKNGKLETQIFYS